MSTIPSKTWPEVLRSFVDARLAGLHVHLPARVLSYDTNTQRATLRPALTFPVTSADEEDLDVLERLPDLVDVPVLQPQGGGFFMHVPVAAGDGVLVEFVDRDPGGYESGAAVSDPVDREVHGLGFPVAILGYGPRSSAIPAPGSGLVLGSKLGLRATFGAAQIELGGSTFQLALATKPDVFFAAVAALAGSLTQPISTPTQLTAAITAICSAAAAAVGCGSATVKAGS